MKTISTKSCVCVNESKYDRQTAAAADKWVSWKMKQTRKNGAQCGKCHVCSGGISAVVQQNWRSYSAKYMLRIEKMSIGSVICLADWCQIHTMCPNNSNQTKDAMCVSVELLMCQKHSTKMPELIEFKPMFAVEMCRVFSSLLHGLPLTDLFAFNARFFLFTDAIDICACFCECVSVNREFSKCFEMLSISTSARIWWRSMTISWF